MTAPLARKAGRYATAIGGKHTAPGVTTVIGVLDKPALPWGAAKETAMFAVEHYAEWRDLTPADAIDRLRRHHRGVWDRKANIGSFVHKVNETWIEGTTIDIADVDPFLPASLRGDHVARELFWNEANPYVDGLALWWGAADPQFVMSERSVVHPEPGYEYGGTGDLKAIIDSTLWSLDIKTGKLDKDTERPYPEVALQLTALERAEHLGIYDAKGMLVAFEPNMKAERHGVLHVPGGGECAQIYPVDVTDDLWMFFRHLRKVWEGNKLLKNAVHQPVPMRKAEVV